MTLPSPKLDLDDEALLALVAAGDCAKLTADQKRRYLLMRCAAAGIDPRTQPFEYITLNGKLVLYARKAATEQLTRLHQLSHDVRSEKEADGIYEVWVRASDPTGRYTDELGATPLPQGGDARCNAKMKAVTKAKRRATLSHCGLGMLDETELETIPAARGSAAALVPPQRLEGTAVLTPTAAADAVGRARDSGDPTVEREAPLVLAPSSDDEEPIARQEIIALTEAVRASGKSEQRFKTYVRTKYGYKTRKDIPRRLYAELMTWAKEGD